MFQLKRIVASPTPHVIQVDTQNFKSLLVALLGQGEIQIVCEVCIPSHNFDCPSQVLSGRNGLKEEL
ncbi:hypothetical protein FVER14953_20511 [Fusarium verticillioides]|nr:hypothetical protein FVER14953_20511 [Fusarium verticillioides]